MYTHFSKSFYENGKINERFAYLIERLSNKNGWFVPTGTLLDYLLSKKSLNVITPMERTELELRWLFKKICKRFRR